MQSYSDGSWHSIRTCVLVSSFLSDAGAARYAGPRCGNLLGSVVPRSMVLRCSHD